MKATELTWSHCGHFTVGLPSAVVDGGAAAAVDGATKRGAGAFEAAGEEEAGRGLAGRATGAVDLATTDFGPCAVESACTALIP